ncbi:hypothetical protein BSL78_13641 [Apostichopus japonicus]|uniref:Uncharacterized protein n=1 Tax=Stichopus japonicus TaxID=307972 RepID=A0A2G8KNB0_STIJA|nr:hypothetical protein BSL78_13641 [Apostichopus japonicus]
MGNYHRGQVGVGYYRKWLQNRIHLQPTLRGRRKANTDTHGPRPKIGSRGGDCGPAGQAGSYRGAGGDGTPLPVVLLSHTKTGRNLASHLKPQTPQPKVCQAKTIPHGKPTCCLTPSQKGHVGGDRRPKGRLLTHSNAQGASPLRSLPLRRQRLPLQVPPVRALHRPEGIHQSSRSDSLLSKKEGSYPIRVPRRLASSRQLTVGDSRQRLQDSQYPPGAGVDSQRGEVPTDPHPDHPVPGGNNRFYNRGCQTVTREDRLSRGYHEPYPDQSDITIPYLAPGPRAHGEHGRPRQPLQVTHASPAAAPSTVPRLQRPAHDHTDQQVGRSHATPTVVEHTEALEPGSSLYLQPPDDLGHNRRLALGMGRPLGQSNSLGNVVSTGTVPPHQRPRNAGSSAGSGSLPHSSPEHPGHHLLRQHDGGGLHQQTGRHQIRQVVPSGMGSTHHSLRFRHGPTSLTHSRKGQCDGRRPIQGTSRPNEWTLSQQTCDRIFLRFGRPLIDLFARGDNNRLPTFCSRGFHPQAFHIDAMSLSWDGLDAYLFPPLCMISQVLRKIRSSRGDSSWWPPFGHADLGSGRSSNSSRTYQQSFQTRPICCPRDGER